MRRLEALDGLRGFFLLFMLINHMSFTGGYLLVKFNHGELGYVQDAQGFVFLSGLLIGLVHAPRMVKHGYQAGASKMLARAGELYVYALGSLAVIMLLAEILPQSGTYWEPWLWQLAENDFGFAAAAAVLLYQPTYMDILPQYIVYLIVAPPLLWLCVTGRAAWVALGSFAVWAGVQLGFHLPLANAIHAAMGSLYDGLEFRAHFNVLAWQALFMGGVVLGALTATRQIDWSRILRPERTELFWTAAALLAMFCYLRLGTTWGVVPQSMVERVADIERRAEFSLLFLVNFAALAYLVAWLMIAGPRSESAGMRRAAAFLHGVFTLSFLRLLGRHSLQVYCWHIIVVYLLKGVDWHHGPFPESVKTLIALGAVASLALPPLWRERQRWMPALRPAG